MGVVVQHYLLSLARSTLASGVAAAHALSPQKAQQQPTSAPGPAFSEANFKSQHCTAARNARTVPSSRGIVDSLLCISQRRRLNSSWANVLRRRLYPRLFAPIQIMLASTFVVHI